MRKLTLTLFAAGLLFLSCEKNPDIDPSKKDYGKDVTILSSQKEVNSFEAGEDPIDTLVVRGSDITDLSPISTDKIGTLIVEKTSIKSIICEIPVLGGSLIIRSNPKLEDIGYMGLIECGGDIILLDNPLLWNIDEIRHLDVFDGQYIYDSSAKFKFDIEGYTIKTAEDIKQIRTKTVKELSVNSSNIGDREWAEICGRVDEIQKGITIGRTSITSLGDFFEKTVIGGNIAISFNAGLTSTEGLAAIKEVKGDFKWLANGNTDYSLFRNWYDSKVVAGKMIVSDTSGKLMDFTSSQTGHKDLDFTITNGVITEEVLNNYLSRAVTEAEFLNSKEYNCDHYWGTDDDERKILNIGAKFVGRATYAWNKEKFFQDAHKVHFDRIKERIDRMHAADPDIIFQAAVFEITSNVVSQIAVPDWVFEAFGKPYESRNFNYEKIKCPTGQNATYWGANSCVPDMSQEETQMWFYYMMVRYMEVGIEAFHCGQVELMASMGDSANNYAGYRRLFKLVREAAKTKARRGFVLLDAHTSGIVVNGEHLLDFCSYPLRLKEVLGSDCLEAELEWQWFDGIIGRTKAGKTPSGWTTTRLPYLLEFDNFGPSSHPGEANLNDWFCWGYDEISWFGLLDDSYARYFLNYAVSWMAQNDPMGHIQMPGTRVAADCTVSPYKTNTKSDACPTGRNMEETIKTIWKNQ